MFSHMEVEIIFFAHYILIVDPVAKERPAMQFKVVQRHWYLCQSKAHMQLSSFYYADVIVLFC